MSNRDIDMLIDEAFKAYKAEYLSEGYEPKHFLWYVAARCELSLDLDSQIKLFRSLSEPYERKKRDA